FLLLIRSQPRPTLFPYTTLFRSLSEAIRLAEPERYIRSFVDEGQPIAALLTRLRAEQHKHGETPYLDIVLVLLCSQSGKQSCYGDRKSTRLNSSHVKISYAVFCL